MGVSSERKVKGGGEKRGGEGKRRRRKNIVGSGVAEKKKGETIFAYLKEHASSGIGTGGGEHND